MTALAAVLIVAGGVLQLLGVVGVLVELRAIRRRLSRPVEQKVYAEGATITVTPGKLTVDDDSSRLDVVGRDIAELRSEVATLRAEMRSGNRFAREVVVDRTADVERLARELATPHRIASWSAGAILVGVAFATVGGVLALS